MSRFRKFLHRHVKQVEGIGKKAFAIGQQMNPMQGMGGMGGMFGMGGSQGNSATDPNEQARSDAAQALKRQAGGAQISFTGNNETPVSQA